VPLRHPVRCILAIPVPHPVHGPPGSYQPHGYPPGVFRTG